MNPLKVFEELNIGIDIDTNALLRPQIAVEIFDQTAITSGTQIDPWTENMVQ